MDSLPTTLSQAIDTLARETGATPAETEQVQALFTSKGISLDEDATPFAGILRETFERQVVIRRAGAAARQAERVGSDLQRIKHLCAEQQLRLLGLSGGMQRLAQQVEANGERLKRFRYYLAEFYTPLDP